MILFSRKTDGPRITLAAPVSLTFAAAAEGEPAKRPTFAIKGYSGAVVSLAGWYYPVIVDLAGLKSAGDRIPALLNHDPAAIVGATDKVVIDSAGVQLTGMITAEDANAEQVVTNARNGFPWQASIGASPTRQEFLKQGAETVVNGRKVVGPLIIAREAILREISFVALGADSQTSASVAASLSQGSIPMNFEAWLQARGIDPAALTDPVRTTLQAAFNAEQSGGSNGTSGGSSAAPNVAGQGNGQPSSLEEVLAAHRAEEARRGRITAIVAEAISSRPVLADELEAMARTAIEARSTVQEFELAVLRLRAGSTSARPRHDPRIGGQVIEAAICLSGGLVDASKYYDEKTLDLADSRFGGGLGLKDVLVLAARENGWVGHTTNDIRSLLEAAFRPSIRAEFSTLSLPGILSNVANKFLLAGFTSIESSWREIAAKKPVRDFKTTTSYSLTGGMTYDKVGPTGELKHATLGELPYSNQADSYGKILGISRKDLINDDLNALTQIPMKLGRGAALKLNLVFWTEFLSGVGSFWAAGNGNLISGGTSALSSSALGLAQAKFRKQVDPDQFPLGLTPKILLVPTELEVAAEELMTSILVNTGGAATDAKVPNRNVWSNKFKPVSSSYLSNASIANYSATAWWLLADPADLPTIEVAFLNGRETPIVESADADFDTLGIKFRGYHDFGVSKQEYRASTRSAGA